MFKKEYQGGSHVEVFSAQGRDPLAQWKLTGSVNREYYKDVRGYVVAMEGGSSTTNTKMQLPKTDKGSLALVQPYLVFQFMVPDGARLAIDLSVIDKSGSRRRIQMSTSQREVATTPLNARVPLAGILTGQWVNVCLNLDSIVSGLFKGQAFKSLEGVTLGGSCLIRRVFTLKSPPPDTVADSATEGPPIEEIPRTCQMPTGGLTVQTQVLSFVSLSSPARNKEASSTSTVDTHDSSSSDNLVSTEERPTHIAFGQKVAIPDHILTSKQSGRSALPSRQSSADSFRKGKENELAQVDGEGFQPRPPSKPADPTILRVQKKRVRMISGGKQRSSASSQNSTRSVEPGSTSADSGFQTGTSDAASNKSAATIDEAIKSQGIIHVPTDTGTPIGEKQPHTVSTLVDSQLDQDEHLALDVLKYKDQADPRSQDDVTNQVDCNSGLVGVGADTSAVSDDYLNSTGDSQLLDTSATSSVRQSELDSSVDEVLYLYRSLPKSAERKQSDIRESLDEGRSAGLDEDFVSPVKDKISMHFVPPVAEIRPRSSRNQKKVEAVVKDDHLAPPEIEESGVAEQLNETRLSDDYDWRQYASVDGTDLTQSEHSLRTRLANAASSQQETPRALNVGPLRSESAMEGTLSGSVTHSGWTEKFKDAALNPLHDSLDTQEMGGMLSPLMGTLTDEPDFAVDPAKSRAEGEELELMYDPQLNCFYDPNTGKYYELAQ